MEDHKISLASPCGKKWTENSHAYDSECNIIKERRAANLISQKNSDAKEAKKVVKLDISEDKNQHLLKTTRVGREERNKSMTHNEERKDDEDTVNKTNSVNKSRRAAAKRNRMKRHDIIARNIDSVNYSFSSKIFLIFHTFQHCHSF